jgi:hypothetical protein
MVLHHANYGKTTRSSWFLVEPSICQPCHWQKKMRILTSTTFQPPVNGFSSSVSTRVKTIAYLHESTASSDPTTASPVFAFRYKSSSWVANVTRNTGTLLSSILPELICGSAILGRRSSQTYIDVLDIQDLGI